jgi:UDP-2-acetamido-2-deoxy-ribo-hexuluronate aminotransferase
MNKIKTKDKTMMPFIDLKSQYASIKDKVQQRINNVLEHGQYIMGPEVEELEKALAEYVGVKHAVTMGNGTDALLVPLMALGIGAGDEVITTAFSFFAAAEMISLIGAKPVFVDIEPGTYNIDASAIESKITSKTKAIIPVGLYGQTADMDAINMIAAKHGLFVIEDAAQSFGATYKGKKSGNLALCASTSFFPAKPLGCYGDGGANFTNDDTLAKAFKEIRNQGQEKRYFHTRIGINGRLDTLQCAILLEKLAIFPMEVQKRHQIAAIYDSILSKKVKVINVAPERTCVYAQYTIEVENRDQFAVALHEHGIPTSVHYPLSLNKQPVYKSLGYHNESFAHSDHAASHVISLPMHPYLSELEVETIAKTVLKYI